MAIPSVLWKLASPYDAYVSHVAQLNAAIERIRYFLEVLPGYEAGVAGSERLAAGTTAAEDRVQRFRQRLAAAAQQLSDDQFEEFIAHLGGGSTADVDSAQSQARTRLGGVTRGLEEYFGIAGRELAILEARGYNPARGDVARQLRDNHLPATTLAEYRSLLHQLGARAGMQGQPAGAR